MDQTSRTEIKVNNVADQERERDLMPPLGGQIIARKRVLNFDPDGEDRKQRQHARSRI